MGILISLSRLVNLGTCLQAAPSNKRCHLAQTGCGELECWQLLYTFLCSCNPCSVEAAYNMAGRLRRPECRNAAEQLSPCVVRGAQLPAGHQPRSGAAASQEPLQRCGRWQRGYVAGGAAGGGAADCAQAFRHDPTLLSQASKVILPEELQDAVQQIVPKLRGRVSLLCPGLQAGPLLKHAFGSLIDTAFMSGCCKLPLSLSLCGYGSTGLQMCPQAISRRGRPARLRQ